MERRCIFNPRVLFTMEYDVMVSISAFEAECGGSSPSTPTNMVSLLKLVIIPPCDGGVASSSLV